MAADSYFLVYFAGSTTIADAGRALGRSLHVVDDGETLVARWADQLEPELVIGLNAEPWVANDADERE